MSFKKSKSPGTMEHKAGSSSPSGRTTRPPKPRNSDARKEQNRIASRAYREKRKQRLALLDEILKTDSPDSISSVSDGSEDLLASTTPYPESRHGSRSPITVNSTAANIPSPWLSSNPAAVPGIIPYGSGAVPEPWLNHSDMFPGTADLPNTFVSPVTPESTAHHHASPMDASARYLGAPIPTVPSNNGISLDQSFPESSSSPFSIPTHLHSAQQHFNNTETFAVQCQQHSHQLHPGQTSSLDPATMRAYESFSSLDENQQQQLLCLIRNERAVPRPSSHERGRSATFYSDSTPQDAMGLFSASGQVYMRP